VARWYYDFTSTVEGKKARSLEHVIGKRRRRLQLQERLEVYEERYGKVLHSTSALLADNALVN
jgi:hypothetical protein